MQETSFQLDKQAVVPRTGDWEGNGPALEAAKKAYRDQGPARQAALHSIPTSRQIHEHPEPKNVTLFGNRVFADVIKSNY